MSISIRKRGRAADEIPLSQRAELIALAGGRTHEQLILEFRVWNMLYAIYADGSDGDLTFTLQRQPFSSMLVDTNIVYALVCDVEDTWLPPITTAQGLMGRALTFSHRYNAGLSERAYAKRLYTTHVIKKNWIIAHASFPRGSVTKLYALVDRLVDTLLIIHQQLETALNDLCAILSPEAQDRIRAERDRRTNAVADFSPDPSAAIPDDDRVWRGGDSMDGYRRRPTGWWHDKDPPQHRLYRTYVYVYVMWIFQEEGRIGRWFYQTSVRQHLVARPLAKMSDKEIEWSGAVCLGEAARRIHDGDTERGVVDAYMASAALHGAALHLHKIQEILERTPQGDFALSDDDATMQLARVLAENTIGQHPIHRRP